MGLTVNMAPFFAFYTYNHIGASRAKPHTGALPQCQILYARAPLRVIAVEAPICHILKKLFSSDHQSLALLSEVSSRMGDRCKYQLLTFNGLVTFIKKKKKKKNSCLPVTTKTSSVNTESLMPKYLREL
jgi:hypothetical protein